MPNTKAKAAPAPKADKAAEREALVKRIASERKTAFDVFTKLSASVSIPIKPVAAFKAYKRDVPATFTGASPTPRRAAAIYIALLANGGKLETGAKFPRKFDMRGAAYCLDNGAIKRCTEAGIITYDSKTETVTVRDHKLIASAIKTAGFKL